MVAIRVEGLLIGVVEKTGVDDKTKGHGQQHEAQARIVPQFCRDSDLFKQAGIRGRH